MLEPAKCSAGCHSKGTGAGAGVVLTELNHHLALGASVPDHPERRERGAYTCLPALPDACSPLFSTWLSSLEVFKEGPRSLTDGRIVPHMSVCSISLPRPPPWEHPGCLQSFAGAGDITNSRGDANFYSFPRCNFV